MHARRRCCAESSIRREKPLPLWDLHHVPPPRGDARLARQAVREEPDPPNAGPLAGRTPAAAVIVLRLVGGRVLLGLRPAAERPRRAKAHTLLIAMTPELIERCSPYPCAVHAERLHNIADKQAQLDERATLIDEKLDKLKYWIMGTLATSVFTLLGVLLTVKKG